MVDRLLFFIFSGKHVFGRNFSFHGTKFHFWALLLIQKKPFLRFTWKQKLCVQLEKMGVLEECQASREQRTLLSSYH